MLQTVGLVRVAVEPVGNIQQQMRAVFVADTAVENAVPVVFVTVMIIQIVRKEKPVALEHASSVVQIRAVLVRSSVWVVCSIRVVFRVVVVGCGVLFRVVRIQCVSLLRVVVVCVVR
jgi:hypothetical protein